MSEVTLGWGAPSVKEQFPSLLEEDALHFDADNAAITRLYVRGVITDRERGAARQRLTNSINQCLAKARGES